MTFEHDSEHEPSDAEDRLMTLTGRTVLDSRSAKVGKVTDVLFEEGTPDWAVVKTGPLRGEHFVPLEHTFVDEDGRLILPLDKTEIKRAPRVGRDHVITSQARNELRDYYGIAA
jgi:sporulation protein YlmC with PRC-barrel domain